MIKMLENFFKSKSDDALNNLYKYLYDFKDWRDSEFVAPNYFYEFNYSNKIEQIDFVAEKIMKRFSKEVGELEADLKNKNNNLKDKHLYIESKRLSIENKEISLKELQEKVMNQKLERDLILDIKEKELGSEVQWYGNLR